MSIKAFLVTAVLIICLALIGMHYKARLTPLVNAGAREVAEPRSNAPVYSIPKVVPVPGPPVVARVTSPSGKLDAVLVEDGDSATKAFTYEVFIVRKGGVVTRRDEDVASIFAAIRNPKAYGANLRWASDRELDVEYYVGQKEQNHGPVALEGLAPVEIKLKSGILDADAPPGSMQRNVQDGRGVAEAKERTTN
jgi:hypothetical protein